MMNEVIPYPFGWENRQRRPRGIAGGAVLGALAAYLLTRDPAVTVTAGAIGAAISNQPLALSEAVRRTFDEKGPNVVSFYRLGPYAARVLFRYKEVYWTLESRTPTTTETDMINIEDWLYGDLVKQLDDFLDRSDMRLNP